MRLLLPLPVSESIAYRILGTRGGSRGRTGPPPGLSAPEVASQGMRRPIDSAGSQASDDRVIGQAAQLNLRETGLGSGTASASLVWVIFPSSGCANKGGATVSLITEYLLARGVLPQTALDHGFEFDTAPSKALITQRLKGDLRFNGLPVSSIAKEILWIPIKGSTGVVDAWMARPLPSGDGRSKVPLPTQGDNRRVCVSISMEFPQPH